MIWAKIARAIMCKRGVHSWTPFIQCSGMKRDPYGLCPSEFRTGFYRHCRHCAEQESMRYSFEPFSTKGSRI